MDQRCAPFQIDPFQEEMAYASLMQFMGPGTVQGTQHGEPPLLPPRQAFTPQPKRPADLAVTETADDQPRAHRKRSHSMASAVPAVGPQSTLSRYFSPPPGASASAAGSRSHAPADRVLIVKQPWAGLITSGVKTWELRGSHTHVRGRVGLVASGTGKIVGGATLVDCHGPLSAAQLAAFQHRHCVPLHAAGSHYKQTFAWEFADAAPLATPVSYTHKKGAIIWVLLPEPVVC